MIADYADVFKKNYLVAGLSDEEIDKIAELAEFGCLLADECLIKKGDTSSDLFVILEGVVCVYTDKGDKLGDCGPGSVIGEVALVDAGPRSGATAGEGISFLTRLRIPLGFYLDPLTAVMLLVVTGVGGRWMQRKRRTGSAALLPLLVLLSLSQLAGSFAVLPPMARLQSQITSFEVDAPRTPERNAFGRWHGISQSLMLVNLACLGALLAVQAGAGHRPEDHA